MNPHRLRYLQALEIDVWQRRDSLAPPLPESSSVAAPPLQEAPVPSGPSASTVAVTTLDWAELEQRVQQCQACELYRTRTRPVFGVGNIRAQWMVIGEAPGADEDRQGEPFVGRAGQLLNSMLKAMGLAREEVYIANVLKSRPPGNRDPKPEEVRACISYLFRQIELINPRLLLCVGRIAAQSLLNTDTPIGKLRGKLHSLDTGGPVSRPLIVTYHPAYLLRSPVEKRKAWSDLVLAMQMFEQLSRSEAASPTY
jgi:DNA polymerase